MNHLLKNFSRYLVFAIPLLTCLVYAPALMHDFVNYDDPVYVTENPNIRAGLTLKALKWAFTPGYDANWIPLTWISHMLDIQLFDLNPAGHHCVNIIIHAASTTLLYICLRKATGAPWRSGMVALLFGLHPLHVESVAWVAERKDVLSAFFWMLTMLAYVRYTEMPGRTRYLCVLLFFTLGLMAKPMLVTLPIILLLLDYWPLNRFGACCSRSTTPPDHPPVRHLLLEKVPFLMLAAASSTVTFLVHKSAGGTHDQYTIAAKISRALIYYVEYMRKMVWPAKLAVIYPFSKYPPSLSTVAAAAAILLALTILALWLRPGAPWMITGWFWYLITLFPVIGLVHIGQHSVADRYTYIPLTGLFLGIVWSVPELVKRLPHRDIALAVLAIATLIIMAAITSRQLSHWKNGITLFSHAAEVTEGNWVAHNNLGQALFDQGKIDESIQEFKLSIQAKPSYAVAFSNLGVAYYQKKDLSQSLEAFKNVLMFDSKNDKAHFCLGILYLEMEKPDLALQEYTFLKSANSPYAAELMKEMVSRTE